MTFKDPFEEAWLKEQVVEAGTAAEEAVAEVSSPGSPRRPHDAPPSVPAFPVPPPPSAADGVGGDDDEEEGRMKVQLDDFPSSNDSDRFAWQRTILSSFTKEQTSRYEAFRRSGFRKGAMKKILTKITGDQQASVDINIVLSALAKMFVGDLVETARVVMTERNDSGPIRPCHIRESYRRLRLEGKTFQRTVPRLFR